MLIVLSLLQRPYKSPIFSFIAFQHYLQIIAGVLLCNYLGQDIDYSAPFRSTATITSSIGLVFLMLPVIYVQAGFPVQNRESLTISINRFSIDKVMYAYIISFFIANFLLGIAFVFGGLTQIILWLTSVKWILFLLFGYMCILKNEKKRIFYLFVVLEFITGFYSFFSDFKTVLYFVLILLLSLIEEVDLKSFFYGLLIVAVLVLLALFWTNVKDRYRAFLNGGEKSQNVTVNGDDALNKLYDLSNNTTGDNLEGSIPQLLDRVQYTYFFAKTIQRVPDIIPYQNGNNWLDNIEFVTTPRYFNPDKPVLDQSEKASHYTGIHLSGRNKGASFSLGYFAECYIDFGIYGMMVALFFMGIIYALIYNHLLKKSSDNLIFNYCVVGAFFMDFNPYATDGTYLIGRLISGVVTFYFLIRWFFPWFIGYLSLIEGEE
ncbi:MAG TPA: hypothetical protein VK705_08700 [Ferruginibacter sp.]|nr:hypothetical protein [Ferruginibacter sp.]